MKSINYLVKSPNPEKPGEYLETRYNNIKELADDLEIATYTVYLILNGICKYNHPSTRKLKDFIILKEKKCDKTDTDISVKKVDNELKEYRKNIKEQINKLKKELYEFELRYREKNNIDFANKFNVKKQNKII